MFPTAYFTGDYFPPSFWPHEGAIVTPRVFAPNYGETRYPEPDWSIVTQYPPR